jgi:hypothetical protein
MVVLLESSEKNPAASRHLGQRPSGVWAGIAAWQRAHWVVGFITIRSQKGLSSPHT